VRTKLAQLLALIAILAIALSACTPAATVTSEPTEVMETEEVATEEPVATEVMETEEPTAGGDCSGEVTNLVLMGWSSSPAENTRLQEMVDQYNTQDPCIQATLSQVPDYDTKLQVSLAGGAPPDVFYVDSFKFHDLLDAGALDDGNDMILDQEDFVSSLKDAFTADSQFYCPPKDFSTLALEYNTDLFDAAGLDYPTADWTWDDLQNAAAQLTAEDGSVYGMAITPDMARWLAFLYQAGGSVYNEDGTQMTINSPEAKEALDFYVGLIQQGYAAEPSTLSTGWPGEAFGQGKAAMVIEGNWIMPFLKDQFPDTKFGVAELPQGPAGQATMAFTVCYAAPANGPHLEESWDLINFLTGSEGMAAWTGLGLAMPTRQSLQEPWVGQYPEQEPFLNGADYSHPWQFVAGFQAVLDTLNSGLQQAFAGTMTSDQVLQEAEEVGNQVLAEQ
jgi:multiple sugar transport system substrate-binding protein